VESVLREPGGCDVGDPLRWGKPGYAVPYCWRAVAMGRRATVLGGEVRCWGSVVRMGIILFEVLVGA
jgi:hypothetical protein